MKKLTNLKHIVMVLVLAALPYAAQAQAQGPSHDVRSLIVFLSNIFQKWLIPLLLVLALVYVLLAVLEYIGANENSEKRKEKKQQIFWGIISLFVIISVWSLVAIVQNSFNIFGGGTLKAG